MAFVPLHLTKIAFGSSGPDALRAWLESHAKPDTSHGGEARLTTRYLPKRQEEITGAKSEGHAVPSSLYWIHGGLLVGRSPILGFEQKPDGKWWIRLEPRLIAVAMQPRRAHQGWRYLTPEDAPPDLDGLTTSEAMPAHLVSELAKLGLA